MEHRNADYCQFRMSDSNVIIKPGPKAGQVSFASLNHIALSLKTDGTLLTFTYLYIPIILPYPNSVRSWFAHPFIPEFIH